MVASRTVVAVEDEEYSVRKYRLAHDRDGKKETCFRVGCSVFPDHRGGAVEYR